MRSEIATAARIVARLAVCVGTLTACSGSNGGGSGASGTGGAAAASGGTGSSGGSGSSTGGAARLSMGGAQGVSADLPTCAPGETKFTDSSGNLVTVAASDGNATAGFAGNAQAGETLYYSRSSSQGDIAAEVDTIGSGVLAAGQTYDASKAQVTSTVGSTIVCDSASGKVRINSTDPASAGASWTVQCAQDGTSTEQTSQGCFQR